MPVCLVLTCCFVLKQVNLTPARPERGLRVWGGWLGPSQEPRPMEQIRR